MRPDRDRCLSLLTAAGCSPAVIQHVHAVARLAADMCDHAPRADRSLAIAGSLLHDIGRSWEQGPDHVTRGVEFLAQNDVDPRIVDIVACHLGCGVSVSEAAAMGWPSRRYMPESIEERIVAHADNLTFGVRHVGLAEVLRKLDRRGLSGLTQRMRDLHYRLAADLNVDPDEISRSLARRT